MFLFIINQSFRGEENTRFLWKSIWRATSMKGSGSWLDSSMGGKFWQWIIFVKRDNFNRLVLALRLYTLASPFSLFWHLLNKIHYLYINKNDWCCTCKES